jgi:hypothetical protein
VVAVGVAKFVGPRAYRIHGTRVVLSRENAEEALPNGFLASWACLVEIGAKIYEVRRPWGVPRHVHI